MFQADGSNATHFYIAEVKLEFLGMHNVVLNSTFEELKPGTTQLRSWNIRKASYAENGAVRLVPVEGMEYTPGLQ
jgi:hypothetical protein